MAMERQLIQGVRLVDAVTGQDQVTDVAIAQGQIEAISPHLSPTAETHCIDGTDKILLPGLVDLYSTSGEPGHESRETLASLLAAGRAGGFTRLGLLPTTDPAIDHPAGVADLLTRRATLAQGQTLPHLYPWAALTQATAGETMAELGELAQTGIIGFTDGRPLGNTPLLRRILEYAQPLGKPIALWPRDRTLVGQGVAREGANSLIYGLPGDPALSETTALATLLECVAAIGTPVHVMRLSTARGVELVAQAKAQGLPITASTPWMHLLLNTADLKSYDPNLRVSPPLGNPADQAALIEGIEKGTVDAIAVDHLAYTYEEKTVGFPSAPPGAIGLELALPLLWETFVASGRWSAMKLIQQLSTAPAQIWGHSPPTIQVGRSPEMVLFDPQVTWTVEPSNLHSLGTNTPWCQRTLRGKVVEFWAGA